MSNDEALFGNDEPPAGLDKGEQPVTPRIADWQVNQLRSALSTHGVQDMTERQQLIETLAGRAVSSLRELTSQEAQALLVQLSARSAPAKGSVRNSTWDDREEDTWIDRL